MKSVKTDVLYRENIVFSHFRLMSEYDRLIYEKYENRCFIAEKILCFHTFG